MARIPLVAPLRRRPTPPRRSSSASGWIPRCRSAPCRPRAWSLLPRSVAFRRLSISSLPQHARKGSSGRRPWRRGEVARLRVGSRRSGAAAPQALAAATARRDVEARGEERIRRSGGRVGGGTALYMAHGQGASSGLVWDHGVGYRLLAAWIQRAEKHGTETKTI